MSSSSFSWPTASQTELPLVPLLLNPCHWNALSLSTQQHCHWQCQHSFILVQSSPFNCVAAFHNLEVESQKWFILSFDTPLCFVNPLMSFERGVTQWIAVTEASCSVLQASCRVGVICDNLFCCDDPQKNLVILTCANFHLVIFTLIKLGDGARQGVKP